MEQEDTKPELDKTVSELLNEIPIFKHLSEDSKNNLGKLFSDYLNIIVKRYKLPKIQQDQIPKYTPSKNFPTNTVQEQVSLKLHINMPENLIESILIELLSFTEDWKKTNSIYTYTMIVRQEVIDKYRNIITKKLGFKCRYLYEDLECTLTILDENIDDECHSFRDKIHKKLE